MKITKEIVVKVDVAECVAIMKLLGEMSTNDYNERFLDEDTQEILNGLYRELHKEFS
ncbi:hypothetical protein [Sulfurovum sp.]|uniref:hypothetical protein n=1 Tax=Sulfurovum sp. TaxID=1969726 RepID=UPI003568972B